MHLLKRGWGTIIVLLVSVAAIWGGATFGRVKTWNDGDTLTAADQNTEFNNILNNLTPAGIDDQSATLVAMQATANPYPASVASQATDLAGELQRIRYQLTLLNGQTYWYQTPVFSPTLGGTLTGSYDGWIGSTITWSTGSASTVYFSGDWTSVIEKGARVKITQTTKKYFTVVAVSSGVATSTLTLTGGSDYTLANAPITSAYYSAAQSPQGYPDWFAYSVSLTGVTSNPTNGTNGASFSINGHTVRIIFRVTYTTEGSGIYLLSLPPNVTINTTIFTVSTLVDTDAGINSFGAVLGEATMDNAGGVWSRANYKVVVYDATHLAFVRGSQTADPQNRTDVLGSGDALIAGVGGTIAISGNSVFSF